VGEVSSAPVPPARLPEPAPPGTTVPLAPVRPAAGTPATTSESPAASHQDITGCPKAASHPDSASHPRAFARLPLTGVRTDPRVPALTRMVVTAAAAGVVVGLAAGQWFGLAAGQWLGLAAAVLAAAAGALVSARISPVVPPKARAGSARRRTRRRLARLAPAGYLSLPNRLVPGAGTAISELVAGPAGVYALESQVWDRRLPVRAAGGGLFHGPFGQQDLLARARQQAEQASRLIGAALGQPVAVRPALVIYGPAVPWERLRVSGVDVVGGRRLRRYLRQEARRHGGQRLDERQAELIRAVAAQVLPPAPR
jgi:hypothetical protein